MPAPHLHPALPDHRPLVIAHRAGNDLAAARRAIDRGTDVLEADVWRFRQRLEVRHLKTMGSVPLLWDQWTTVRPGWGPRLQLPALIDATARHIPVMLDLKGTDPALGPAVVDGVRERYPDLPIVLCSRNWMHLDAVAETPGVHRIHSIGNEEERAGVWSRLESMAHPAVSIHRRLVTPELARRFDELGVTSIVWAAESEDDARRLLDLGMDGLTLSEGPLQDWLLAVRDGD